MKTPQAVNNYNFSTLYIANRTNGASILELICYTIILLLFFSKMYELINQTTLQKITCNLEQLIYNLSTINASDNITIKKLV